MRVLKTLFFLLLVTLVATVVFLFGVQNLDQRVELGLNLGAVGAWRMVAPQPVVFVMLGSFALGAVLVGLVSVYEIVVFQRRISRLNQMIKGGGSPGAGPS